MNTYRAMSGGNGEGYVAHHQPSNNDYQSRQRNMTMTVTPTAPPRGSRKRWPDPDAVHAAMALISIPGRASGESTTNVTPSPDNQKSYCQFISPSSKEEETPPPNGVMVNMPYERQLRNLHMEESSIVTWSSTGSVSDTTRDDMSQSSPVHKSESLSTLDTDPSTIFVGSASLSMPEDKDVLSPLHCFMRRYCIEAFTVNDYDTQDVKGVNRLRPGMVGIRCVHCKSRPSKDRMERAVCYPSSVKNIYYSMETWQRRHAPVCQDIPDWVRKEMSNLIQASKNCAGGRRKYWADAAIKLGMVDSADGIRFDRHPECNPIQDKVLERPVEVPLENTVEKQRQSLVKPEDKDLITSNLYLLMSQMEPCYFTEEDRTGGRSKIKTNQIGYPGIQCQHCSGKAGFGRYFPTSAHSLTLANSDRNIYNHMMKCRRCPEDIKNKLKKQKEQRQGADDKTNNRRGSRKIFFTRVWDQLHGSQC